MASLVKIFSPSKCKTQDNILKKTRMPGHTTTNYIYLKYELWKHLIQGMHSWGFIIATAQTGQCGGSNICFKHKLAKTTLQ